VTLTSNNTRIIYEIFTNHLICTQAVYRSLLSHAIGKKSTNSEDTAPSINKGRELVMASIEAHGGAEKWYSNGALQFRWKYHLTDRGPNAIADSIQTVDTKTLSAVHEVPGKDIRFGVDKGNYWISPKGATFTPPAQFWTLTPYYFIGIPFVFNDENAHFELLNDPIDFEGKSYTQVKITYNQHAGDSPDDHYVLLIDPETKLTRGTYYTVTNKLVAPNGPGPEKFISLDGLTEINGVWLASGHRTMKMEEGKITSQMRFTEVSGVKFVPTDTIDFKAPSADLIINP